MEKAFGLGDRLYLPINEGGRLGGAKAPGHGTLGILCWPGSIQKAGCNRFFCEVTAAKQSILITEGTSF